MALCKCAGNAIWGRKLRAPLYLENKLAIRIVLRRVFMRRYPQPPCYEWVQQRKESSILFARPSGSQRNICATEWHRRKIFQTILFHPMFRWFRKCERELFAFSLFIFIKSCLFCNKRFWKQKFTRFYLEICICFENLNHCHEQSFCTNFCFYHRFRCVWIVFCETKYWCTYVTEPQLINFK